MALGARRSHVVGLVLRQGLGLVAAGIAVGVLGAGALSRQRNRTNVGDTTCVSTVYDSWNVNSIAKRQLLAEAAPLIRRLLASLLLILGEIGMQHFIMTALGLLLITSQLAAQTHQPVGVKRPEVVERWIKTMKKTETAIEAGEWKKAKRTIKPVLSEMCARIEGGDGVANLLATATFLRSLSEAGLGNKRAANWDYNAAQTLVPELSTIDLSRYGTVGQLLEPWRFSSDSSEEGETENDSEEKIDVDDVVPPKKVRAPKPKYPYGKYSACLDGPIVVQFIIDERGIPTHPQLLTIQDPLLGYAAMEAVRDWRFKPARLEGEPISVRYNLTVNFRLGRCRNLFAGADRAADGG